MAYFDKYGVKFSDDRKILIDCPRNFEGKYIIPYGVVEIGEWAFGGCPGLTSIEIPDSVQKIGHGAFSGKRKLTTVEMPNSITEIEWGAFENCASLVTINLPESLMMIGDTAFYGCEKLEKIFIPKNVHNIGSHAFADIGPSLFIEVDERNENFCSEHGILYSKDKSNLIHVCNKEGNVYSIPEGVKTISSGAFQWAEFRYVVFPTSLKRIEEEAFLSATIQGLYLRHTYPYDIEIGEDAFEGCAKNCILNIPQGADYIAYNNHTEFKKFRATLFWNGVNS